MIGRLLLYALILIIYFLPVIVARKKRNYTAIALLNLLLGWTIIGWIIALIWAATKDPPIEDQNSISL